MYETRNDLAESARKGVVQLLNDRLAETIDLELQAKHAHWNVNVRISWDCTSCSTEWPMQLANTAI